MNIPEAHDELNNLQREKLDAMKTQYGKCYIVSLWTGDILTEYTGQTIYNFTGVWAINNIDINVVKLINELRASGYNGELFDRLSSYVYDFLKGEILLWSWK